MENDISKHIKDFIDSINFRIVNVIGITCLSTIYDITDKDNSFKDISNVGIMLNPYILMHDTYDNSGIYTIKCVKMFNLGTFTKCAKIKINDEDKYIPLHINEYLSQLSSKKLEEYNNFISFNKDKPYVIKNLYFYCN